MDRNDNNVWSDNESKSTSRDQLLARTQRTNGNRRVLSPRVLSRAAASGFRNTSPQSRQRALRHAAERGGTKTESTLNARINFGGFMKRRKYPPGGRLVKIDSRPATSPVHARKRSRMTSPHIPTNLPTRPKSSDSKKRPHANLSNTMKRISSTPSIYSEGTDQSGRYATRLLQKPHRILQKKGKAEELKSQKEQKQGLRIFTRKAKDRQHTSLLKQHRDMHFQSSFLPPDEFPTGTNKNNPPSNTPKTSVNNTLQNSPQNVQWIDTIQLSDGQLKEMNDGGFYYLLRKKNGTFFDLVICSRADASAAEDSSEHVAYLIETVARSGKIATQLEKQKSGVVDYGDYFTISAQGVTWYEYGWSIKNGQQQQFHTLESWQRCYELFVTLRDFKVFKSFRILKRFLWWRQAVRSRKRRIVTMQLTGKNNTLGSVVIKSSLAIDKDSKGRMKYDSIKNKNMKELNNDKNRIGALLKLNIVFQKSLYEIQKIILVLPDKKLVDFEIGHVSTLYELQVQQRNRENKLQGMLITIFDKLANEISRVGYQYISLTGYSNIMFWAKSKLHGPKLAKTSGVEYSFIEKAALRQQCANVIRLSRLANLQFKQCLRDFVCFSTEQLLKSLQYIDDTPVLSKTKRNSLRWAGRRRDVALAVSRGGSSELIKAIEKGKSTPRTRKLLVATAGSGKGKNTLPDIPSGINLDTCPLLVLRVTFETGKTLVRLQSNDGENNKTPVISVADIVDEMLVSATKQLNISSLSSHQLLQIWNDLHQGGFEESMVSNVSNLANTANISNSTNTANMFLDLARFKTARSGIRSLWTSALERATAFARVFEVYQKVFLANEKILKKLTKALNTKTETSGPVRGEGAFYRKAEASFFKSLIDQFDEQSRKFENIPRYTNLGLIQVDSSSFRNRILPSPIRGRDVVTMLLPSIIIESSSDILSKVRIAMPSSTSCANIQSPAEYCSLMSSVDYAKSQRMMWREKFYRIQDLRDIHNSLLASANLTGSSDVTFTPYESTCVELEDSLDHLNELIADFETFREEKNIFFAQVIRDNAPKIITAISNCRAQLQAKLTSDPSADSSKVLAFISEVSKQAFILSKQVDDSNSHLRQLGGAILLYLDEARCEMNSELSVKKDLWDAISEWGKFLKTLKQSRLCDLEDRLGVNRLEVQEDQKDNDDSQEGKIKTVSNIATPDNTLISVKLSEYLKRALTAHRTVANINGTTSKTKKTIVQTAAAASHANQFGTSSLRYNRQKRFTKEDDKNVYSAEQKMKTGAEEIRTLLPVLRGLLHPSMCIQHWQSIKEVFQHHLDSPEDARKQTVQWFLDRGIADTSQGGIRDSISEIYTRAIQEKILQKTFTKTAVFWQSYALTFVPYEGNIANNANVAEKYDTWVLVGVEEVIDAIEESTTILSTISTSRYSGNIQISADKLRRDLILIHENLLIWSKCQKLWYYLEPVFQSSDIQRQLPNEAKSFARVNAAWREMVKESQYDSVALSVGTTKDLGNKIEDFTNRLESVHFGLETFLHSKRQSFPRFFFLSSADLLGVYSKARDPAAIQSNLRKMFDGIHSVSFVVPENKTEDLPENSTVLQYKAATVQDIKLRGTTVRISSMVSPEGESIELSNRNIRPSGAVERWMSSLENAMRRTIKDLIRKNIHSYPAYSLDSLNPSNSSASSNPISMSKLRAKWAKEHPSQIVSSVAIIAWTRETEKVLNASNENTITNTEPNLNKKNSLKEWFDCNVEQVSELVSLVRQSLTKLQRRAVVALVTADVHARDIIEKLIKRGITNTSEFLWQAQLRHYWEASTTSNETDYIIRQVNGTFLYGYEYLGCCTKLVITPLTDRCWMTITGAIQLKLGASPSGPAGTGKTETTKDLAKCLGKLCIVFNCSEQISFKHMSGLLAGIACHGSWACLDEFNRIHISVLSVIAQQLFTLRTALCVNNTDNNNNESDDFPASAGYSKHKSVECEFENRKLMIQEFCLNVTMNPGYEGRTELPDNLKVFFRPIAMMIPNYSQIAEIMLFSEGFKESNLLSKKMIQLYTLASEQLSQQSHYDYGLRAIKSLLVTAGVLKRSDPHANERTLLIQAMYKSNVPKFVSDDIVLFKAIISDLFPDTIDSLELSKNSNEMSTFMLSAITEMKRHGLNIRANISKNKEVDTNNLITKLFQLKDTLAVRLGVVLLGPAMSGKTSCYKTLVCMERQKLLQTDESNDPSNKHSVDIINPKTVSVGKLYGQFSPLSGEWQDGIASMIIRHRTLENGKKWIVFDGPVDTLWIENMNTVLDDNKTLCLASGERIKLRNNMNLIFECEDLAYASPATVSRCGVIYFSKSVVKQIDIWQSWVNTMKSYMPLSAHTRLHAVGDHLLKEAIDFVDSNSMMGREPLPSLSGQRVQSVCKIFESIWRKKAKLFKLDYTNSHRETAVTNTVVDYLFAFSVIWGLGGALDTKGRKMFDMFIREYLVDDDASHLKAITPNYSINLNDDDIFNVFFDFEEFFSKTKNFSGELSEGTQISNKIVSRSAVLTKKKKVKTKNVQNIASYNIEASFSSWQKNVKTFKYNASIPLSDVVVPTVVTCSLSYFIQHASLNHEKDKPFDIFITGNTGTGKTIIIQDTLAKLENTNNVANISLCLSARTKPIYIQSQIEEKLQKTRFGTYIPPRAKSSCVIFVDDVNLPMIETYGAQPPVELLRQISNTRRIIVSKTKTFEGFEDLNETKLSNANNTLGSKQIQKCSMLCAAAPAGGGRKVLSTRFSRLFTIFCVPNTSSTIAQSIYTSILDAFFTKYPFPLNIVRLCSDIVRITLQLYKGCVTTLLPTPRKSHYIFNLRDINKCIGGIMMIRPQPGYWTQENMLQLWTHETSRVFSDRLVDSTDRLKFMKLQTSILMNNFSEKYTSWIKFRLNLEQKKAPANPLIFCDFLQGVGEQPYILSPSIKTVTTALDDGMAAYNLSSESRSKPLDVIFFRDAVLYVSRIARILRQPRGSALLVGVSGSGRRTLTRVACLMNDMECFLPDSSTTYEVKHFRDDLKTLMMEIITKQEDITLLLGDAQIDGPHIEFILEDVNEILNRGEVTALFTPDEISEISAKLELNHSESDESLEQSKEGDNYTTLNASNIDVWGKFISLIRLHLHIVLCMSPVGENFHKYCRTFPSLVNCCNIIWFNTWPHSALISVANSILHKLPETNMMPININSIASICSTIHLSASKHTKLFCKIMHRYVYISPKAFIDMLNLLIQTITETYSDLMAKQKRLDLGVSKIDLAQESVKKLKLEMLKTEPILVAKAEKISILLQKVREREEESLLTTSAVEKEKQDVQKQKDVVEVLEQEAQKELSVALPALERALNGLKLLDKNDIIEMKSYQKPPSGVTLVMEAICLLLGAQPDWDTAKKILADPKGVLERLEAYDGEALSGRPKLLRKLNFYIQNPEMESVEQMKYISKAAASLCGWIHAIVAFAKVSITVMPKRKNLETLTQQLHNIEKSLLVKQQALVKAQDTLSIIRQELETTQEEMKQLQNEQMLTRNRLERAEKLTSVLAKERIRWRKSSKDSIQMIKYIVGDSFLSAAFISYLGPFTEIFRNKILSEWSSTCHRLGVITTPRLSNFHLSAFIGNPIQQRKWHLDGLPNDIASEDNACMIFKSLCWPMLIDPQEQGVKWLIRLFDRDNSSPQIEKNIKKTKTPRVLYNNESKKTIRKSLLSAVRSGTWLLVRNTDCRINPALQSILRREIYYHDDRKMIKIGDTELEYSKTFRLFMTTKQANPHFLPEVSVHLCLVNFTVTVSGLNAQLLSDVVRRERQDIEDQRTALLVEMSESERHLHNAESNVLSLLSEARGNILDDEDLLVSLNKSKTLAASIQLKLKESERTNLAIEQLRELYISVAVRGTILFFAMMDMTSIESMYQYSLDFFKRLYNLSIDTMNVENAKDEKQSTSDEDHDISKRLDNMIRNLTRRVYQSVSQGLFQKHRPIYRLLIAKRVLQENRQLPQSAWKLFLSGFVANGNIQQSTKSTKELKNPLPHILGVNNWNILRITEILLPELKGLTRHISENASDWQEWATSADIISLPLPGHLKKCACIGLNNGNGDIARLLLVRSFCFEKLLPAVDAVSKGVIGEYGIHEKTTEQKNTSVLSDVYKDSGPATPVLFILSLGADPTDALMRFAEQETKIKHEKNTKSTKLKVLALGQGQSVIAENAIKDAALSNQRTTTDRWILLQNCHVAETWLPKLAQIVEDLNELHRSSVDDKSSERRKLLPSFTSAKEEKLTVHSDFRLWLTSLPISNFPIQLLQQCVKVTTEPPVGIQGIMCRSFKLIDQWCDFENAPGGLCELKSDGLNAWKQLCISLVTFHAVVQERRRFGSIGFNIPYEFNDTDLQTSLVMMRLLIGNVSNESKLYYEGIPWTALSYMIGELCYGGRVTDVWDRRCLTTTLKRFISIEAIRSHIESEGKVNENIYTLHCDTSTTLEDLTVQISSIPPNFTDLSAFGFHENATIRVNGLRASSLLKDCLRIPEVNTSASNSIRKSHDGVDIEEEKTPETDYITELSNNVRNIQKQLSDHINMDALDSDTREPFASINTELETNFGSSSSDSMIVVLCQETHRYRMLVATILDSLLLLSSALRGERLMTTDLDSLGRSLSSGIVPKQWRVKAYPSLKNLGQWVNDLLERLTFIRGWWKRSQIVDADNNLLIDPSSTPLPVFWLGGLFFPQGFCTAVLQKHARHNQVAIDTLGFGFTVCSEMDENEYLENHTSNSIRDRKGGVLISGLFLEGAEFRFSNNSTQGHLTEAKQGNLFSGLPLVQFWPRIIPVTNIRDKEANNDNNNERENTELKSPTRRRQRLAYTKQMKKSLHGKDTTKSDKSNEYMYFYETPVYKTALRRGTLNTTGHSTNFITLIQLPSLVEPMHWILRGTACLANVENY